LLKYGSKPTRNCVELALHLAIGAMIRFGGYALEEIVDVIEIQW
jgi:hypothetical protein